MIGTTSSSQAEALYARATGGGSARQPTDVIVVSSKSVPVSSAGFRSVVRDLATRIRSDPGISSVRADPGRGSPLVSAGGHAALIELRAASDSDIKPVVSAVQAANGGHGFGVAVTGNHTAGNDFTTLSSSDLRHGEIDFGLPIAIVVLLTVAFRSLVVAALSIALNLLSVGAAYGLLTLVFLHGAGASVLGFQKVTAIDAWVPLFLFSVLFALSMDYQVFLMSRIKERHDQTGSTREAVTDGVASTARIITGAALIIVVVFSGFARGQLVMFQQMGFGVAVALILDATLIRMVILPSALSLLGRRSWYLPRWLRWLPHVELEAPGAQAAEGS